MYKSPKDFKNAAKKLNLSKWPVHDCSICGYSCGYVFDGNNVGYDSGCDCVTWENIRPSSWADVADFYNMQHSPKIIEAMNRFWGFERKDTT